MLPAKRKAKKTLQSYLFPLIIFSIIMVLFFSGLTSMSSMTQEKEMENLENAVVQSSVCCYAVEGAYPESLAYLEEHYGITYNKEKYIVRYEVVAKNLRPNIKVMRR